MRPVHGDVTCHRVVKCQSGNCSTKVKLEYLLTQEKSNQLRK